jgi:hypothetical protein
VTWFKCAQFKQHLNFAAKTQLTAFAQKPFVADLQKSGIHQICKIKHFLTAHDKNDNNSDKFFQRLMTHPRIKEVMFSQTAHSLVESVRAV